MPFILLGVLGARAPFYALAAAVGVVFVLITFRNLAAGVALFTVTTFFQHLPGTGTGSSVEVTGVKAAGAVVALAWIVMLMRRRDVPFLLADQPLIGFSLIAFQIWTLATALWAEDPGVSVSSSARDAILRTSAKRLERHDGPSARAHLHRLRTRNASRLGHGSLPPFRQGRRRRGLLLPPHRVGVGRQHHRHRRVRLPCLRVGRERGPRADLEQVAPVLGAREPRGQGEGLQGQAADQDRGREGRGQRRSHSGPLPGALTPFLHDNLSISSTLFAPRRRMFW